QRRYHCPWRNGAVVGTVRYAASHIIEELALDSLQFDGIGAGAVARSDPPTISTIARELEWIGDRVLLLHISRATAVLEVIDTFAAHERVLDPAKIDPDVRNLMGEQRPGVQILVAVAFLPLVGRAPSGIAFGWQRMRRRAEAEHVQQQGFVIAFPPPRQESALGLPAVRDRGAPVLRPLPVGAAIERVGEVPDFPFVGSGRVEVGARG